MEFNADVFSQFDKKWALLSAGPKDDHNTMTICWGSMGTLWNKPTVTVKSNKPAPKNLPKPVLIIPGFTLSGSFYKLLSCSSSSTLPAMHDFKHNGARKAL